MRRLAYIIAVLIAGGCSSSNDGPTPVLSSVSPMSTCDLKMEGHFTLAGSGFSPVVIGGLTSDPAVVMPRVFLIDASGTQHEIPAAGVSAPDASGTMLAITVPDGFVPEATYDVMVINPDGKTSNTLPGALVIRCKELTITGIDPPFGCTCAETNVTISSNDGFVSTPTVEMRPAGKDSPVTLMKRVAFVDGNTLTAVVPEGLALGLYDVRVVDPPSDGRAGTLANGFRVVALPIPTIEDAVADRGPPSTSVSLDIYGSNFRGPITVTFLDRTGAVAATASMTGVTSPGHATATITTPATEDAYLVRVTDNDEMTYSTWSAFIVGAEGASGNLHMFTASSMLVSGRRMLAGVSARDDVGNTFIYAIGGDNGTAALDTLEVAELSKFGALGGWQQEKASNNLRSTRDAPIAAAVVLANSADPFGPPLKTYIYVVGGRNAAGTVLDTVERAMVLRNADAPVVTGITAATGGTLAAGTWYYKVSAICAVADADNPGGETLPSDEQILTIDSAHTAVTLQWNAVATAECTASGYKVYRTAMVNGASQQERLVATTGNVLTFTDTGATAGNEAPLGPGSLGVWTMETIRLNGARWGHQGATIADNNTGSAAAGSSLYVLGGKSNATTGYLGSIEYAGIDANGHLIGTTFATGNTTAMTPRAFFSLVVETSQNVSGHTGTPRLITCGGAEGTGASKELEISTITSGGGNGAWAVPFVNATLLNTVAGNMAVIASNKLWSVGGARMLNNTTQAFSNITAGGDDVAFDTSGNLVAPTQSAANVLLAPRALGAPIVGAGFIYFVGGTSDGTDVANTTYQTF